MNFKNIRFIGDINIKHLLNQSTDFWINSYIILSYICTLERKTQQFLIHNITSFFKSNTKYLIYHLDNTSYNNRMVFVKAISLILVQNLEWQSKIDQQDRSLIWFGASDGLTVLFSPKQKKRKLLLAKSSTSLNISWYKMIMSAEIKL